MLDRQVLLTGREVLAERDDVDAEPGEVTQNLLDLVAGLAQAERQAGLGDRAAPPGVLEELVVARLAPKEALPGPDTRWRGSEGGLTRRDSSGGRVAAAA